ncbi:phosphatase PAP2 family protein [uncultured Lutibacter sp.]|uniref:phosphatase PAP2 family protein n=1 Tax=uncultured Lutibacter sp. TaxID=437739 RepID=UPI002622D89C|nr:phosphatase PAP2 family protein [uncultured Lutibacter sp.]
MELFNSLINYDKQLLIFLHSYGNEQWDKFWLFITNPIYWIPLFFVLFYFGYKAFGYKKTGLISFFVILSSTTSFVLVNQIKNTFQRLRPINDYSINKSIRQLIEANDFSFVSGHSAVSFTIAFLSYWILKPKYRFAYLIFLFPILFAYSRLYLAAHFPIDILFGMILGYLIAFLFFRITSYFLAKI